MRTIVLSAAVIVGLLVCCLVPSITAVDQVEAEGCTFILGFKTLHDTIPEIVGGCVTDVRFDAGGAIQQTTNGTLFWNRNTNVTSFTGGDRTWLIGPAGLQTRLNSERFDWELAAQGMSALSPGQISTGPDFGAVRFPAADYEAAVAANAQAGFADGRQIFRFDTFGSEDFWGGQLKLHQAIAGAANGGVGPGLTPRNALALGLKVDADMLPAEVISALQTGQVNLDDPATTLALLQADAVVGVKGNFNKIGGLDSVGIRCSLCHSTVDNSLAPGIGSRLDGWPNRDLDVGAIVALAPDLSAFTNLLQVDADTVRQVLTAWGPGKFDAELVLDGKGFRPDGKTSATLIPPAFGRAGVNLITWTGWGTVTYWNAFVANLEMHGKGTFFDERLADPAKFPVAARAGFSNVRNTPDLISSKLAALHVYQLALPAPKPPAGTFDPVAAARGQALAVGKARCASCHVPPLGAEPGWNMHLPEEIGIDDFQAKRSPDDRYRTPPLGGTFAHSKGGFFHDGRFPTLMDVVNHYDTFFNLGLNQQEKNDLVEYLKSL